MKIFNVLDPTLNIHQPLLIEASAGTGKTFAIENIVVRALIEDPQDGPPLTIKDILVVTFTKAAAKDLKMRIFQNLQKKESHIRIKRALIEFDLANISTIHAFCYRAMAENATLFRLNKNPEDLSLDIKWKAAEKYFRSALTTDMFTPSQLNILLKPHQNDISLLAKELIKTQGRGIHFAKMETNAILFNKLEIAVKELEFTKEKMMEAFETYAYHFYGLCEGKSKHLKKSYYKTLHAFEPSLELIEVLSCFSKLKKTMPKPPIPLFDALQNKILPLLRQLASYESLFARLAEGYQRELFKDFEESETCDFSYLLIKMHQLIQEDQDFKERLKKKYRTIIIDEFQDTDPLQWKIFNELFSEAALILVGDPKQSIYAFRNADVYTYLNAANSMEAKYLLNTNYRSTPELIAALNHLFEAAPGWIALPYIRSHLTYVPVQAPKPFKSLDPAIHFLFAEGSKLEQVEEVLFPCFLQEVQNLQKKGIPLSSIAFLVRDHFQSDRLFQYFQGRGLSAIQKRSLTLENAVILQDFTYLLRAIKSPRNLGHVQIALGTQFFKRTAKDLEQLNDQEHLAKILYHFQKWHLLWKKEGLGVAIESLLATHFFGKQVQEIFLESLDGKLRYHELRQILEWLMEREDEDALTLIEESLEQPLYPLVDKEAVQILTLHMSKGLEFEVVFALGVINRPPLDKGLILIRHEGNKVLKVSTPEEHTAFLEENDAEKLRQFYVALTRAKSELYIPFIEGWKPPPLGGASPLELWLARIGEPLCAWKELYQRLEQSRRHFLENLIASSPFLERLEESSSTDFFTPNSPLELIPPPFISLYFPKQVNTSFTALAKPYINILKAPNDFNSEIKTPHTLPAGPHTGDFLHQLLKEIPISENVIPFIHHTLLNTPYAPWEKVIEKMISQAFRDLKISEEQCFREMEFTYPLELVHFLPECRSLKGMVKGIIDLFFMRDGKYYLLDWKSNWLGPDDGAYTAINMTDAMQQHHYDLQAALYRRAIQEYLFKVDQRPFDEIFGGVIYYFLRGNSYVIY